MDPKGRQAVLAAYKHISRCSQIVRGSHPSTLGTFWKQKVSAGCTRCEDGNELIVMTCLVGHDHIGVVDVRAEDRLSHRIKIVAHMLVVIYDLYCYAASPPPPCISKDNEAALLKSIHPRSQLYSESNCFFEVSDAERSHSVFSSATYRMSLIAGLAQSRRTDEEQAARYCLCRLGQKTLCL